MHLLLLWNASDGTDNSRSTFLSHYWVPLKLTKSHCLVHGVILLQECLHFALVPISTIIQWFRWQDARRLLLHLRQLVAILVQDLKVSHTDCIRCRWRDLRHHLSEPLEGIYSRSPLLKPILCTRGSGWVRPLLLIRIRLPKQDVIDLSWSLKEARIVCRLLHYMNIDRIVN